MYSFYHSVVEYNFTNDSDNTNVTRSDDHDKLVLTVNTTEQTVKNKMIAKMMKMKLQMIIKMKIYFDSSNVSF